MLLECKVCCSDGPCEHIQQDSHSYQCQLFTLVVHAPPLGRCDCYPHYEDRGNDDDVCSNHSSYYVVVSVQPALRGRRGGGYAIMGSHIYKPMNRVEGRS